MQMLAVIVGVFAVANLPIGPLPIYVGISGLALAATLYVAQRISPYLRVFVVMYAVGYLVLASGTLLDGLGFLPEWASALLPPPFAASAAFAFAAIVYGVSFIPVIRTITTLADPYFGAAQSSSSFGRPFGWLGRTEGEVGTRLVALLIAINFIQVAMEIRFNAFSGDLFNALQEKKIAEFWYQIFGIFCPLAAVWIALAVYEIFVDNSLKIRWRTWMTRRTASRWLENGTHYIIPLIADDTDNPDQRIQADINLFISQTMTLSISLLSKAATLVSFVVILWSLSRGFPIPGTGIVVPGFLVFLVIFYAIAGTWLTHLIGRPLIGLDFRQESVEADFRFSLARLREYGEQVALLRGEKAEISRLDAGFGHVVRNYLQILSRRMRLTTFTAGYSQLSVIFPYVVAAPSYFLGQITLGQFQRVAGAFGQVQSAMSFFISAYTTLASFKANIDRLTSFNRSMSMAEETELATAIGVENAGSGSHDLALRDLKLQLPDGRQIVEIPNFAFLEGSSALVSGPSGSGKSTMFRAISGIWPFGSGHVQIPAGRKVMLIPQKPYIPAGTLRDAVSYPGLNENYQDADIRSALDAVGLSHLDDKLDLIDNWAHHLSGGEQQRLSLARALLAKPDWLLLDEATASLDEPMEATVYGLLAERLPTTTIVSIGHRSTLIPMHDKQVMMHRAENGLYDLREKTASARPSPMPAAE